MIFFRFTYEYPKNEELRQSGKISTFWQIQIAISLDWKKINAFCLFYSIMHSLGLQDIIMDNVVSKSHFLQMSSCVPTVEEPDEPQRDRSRVLN